MSRPIIEHCTLVSHPWNNKDEPFLREHRFRYITYYTAHGNEYLTFYSFMFLYIGWHTFYLKLRSPHLDESKLNDGLGIGGSGCMTVPFLAILLRSD